MIISRDSVVRQNTRPVADEHPYAPSEEAASATPFPHVLPGDETGALDGARANETGVFAPPPLGDICCEIRTVGPAEARAMARVLEQRADEWRVRGRGLDADQRAWNVRIEDTLTMTACLMPGAGDTVFAALLDGEPIGLLHAVQHPTPSLHIAALLTHPGSQGAGWRLMTQAVRHSEQVGRGGHLDLYAMSENSRKAYLAMGFEDKKCGRMTLDPSLPGKPWVRDAQGFWTPRNANL
jgi:ribosomal protein S18 acetylase RimI-like enzyme